MLKFPQVLKTASDQLFDFKVLSKLHFLGLTKDVLKCPV